MKTLFQLSILILGFTSLHLQSFGQAEPEDLIQSFFDDYQNKGSDTALDNLYSTNPWMQRSTEAITNLKEKMATLTEDFVGKCYGFDLIKQVEMTPAFVQYTYLAKFDRQPIRFTFQFYKPNDRWKTYSFKYDGSLDDELEEAGKIK